MLDWNALRDFRVIVDEGSLTKAAAKIGITQPTLSRRLSDLEEQLGVTLLLRSTRRLQLTRAGERILDHAKAMFGEARSISDLAHGSVSSLDGLVRISVTEGLGITWLAGQMAAFRRQYPGIKVELVVSNQFCDLHAREADIAIRLARPTQIGLITRKVADFRFALYASTRYVDAHGIPNTTEDLQHHHGIGLMGTTPTAIWLREIFGESRIVFWSNTLLALRGAVRAGIGIGPVFCFLGDQDAALVPILPASAAVTKEVWLTCTEEMRGNAGIRAAYDYLGNLLNENRHILAGTQPSPDATLVL